MSTIFDIIQKATAKGQGAKVLSFNTTSIITLKSSNNNNPYNKGNAPDKANSSITGSCLRKYKNGICYFMPVVFEHTDLKTKKTTVWTFDEAVVSISGKKNIVETPMQGKKGTVKELIGIDDFEIKFVGVLSNSNDDYPEQEIQELIKLWEINEAVRMNCAFTDYFLMSNNKKNTDYVVIKSLDFPAMEGFEDIQIITMGLVSDTPFEIELNNEITNS
jgi:hypothetical protein